jgi:signal transduction histidine kinase
MGYMILAFGWWSFHLWQQNEKLFKVEKALLEHKFSGRNSGLNLSQLEETVEYAKIENIRQRGKRMVVAEGLFFTACLLFGLWIINRSANREVTLARQRRNFLLSITHELKSPIASLRLVMETLIKRTLTDAQRELLLSNGLKDADRLQQLVEDLLLAARLEDKWQPVPEPMDLEAVARDCVEGLRVRFPEANIKILHNESMQPVLVDRMGMVAVIKNLLENAVKYSPAGSPIEFSAAMHQGKCRVRVADQGQGIPDREKTQVFEKFYRLGNEDTRKHTGTGLGLYIVSQVMKAHQGVIELTDNAPRGTVFTVTL